MLCRVLSLPTVGKLIGESLESVGTVLKLKFYLQYAYSSKLGDDDPDRRIQYYETTIEKRKQHPNFLKNISFTEECTFLVKKQNFCYWDNENLHIEWEDYTQYLQIINV